MNGVVYVELVLFLCKLAGVELDGVALVVVTGVCIGDLSRIVSVWTNIIVTITKPTMKMRAVAFQFIAFTTTIMFL
jgi:hypothetical protein